MCSHEFKSPEQPFYILNGIRVELCLYLITLPPPKIKVLNGFFLNTGRVGCVDGGSKSMTHIENTDGSLGIMDT